MSIWSGISKLVSKAGRFLTGGAKATGAASAATSSAAVGASVVSWASAFKVAVAGGFTWLFLSGGASNVVAGVLGIDESVAQVLIIFAALVLLLLAMRYLINWARDRFSLNEDYLREPVTRRRDDKGGSP